MVAAPDGTFERKAAVSRIRQPAGMASRLLSSEQFSRDMARRAGHPAARAPQAQELLTISSWAGLVVAVPGFLSRSLIREVTMNVFSYRKHLRFLTHSQRRRWWEQKKRLSPRVRISGAYVPPNVSREFAYVKVG